MQVFRKSINKKSDFPLEIEPNEKKEASFLSSSFFPNNQQHNLGFGIQSHVSFGQLKPKQGKEEDDFITRVTKGSFFEKIDKEKKEKAASLSWEQPQNKEIEAGVAPESAYEEFFSVGIYTWRFMSGSQADESCEFRGE